MIGKICRFAEFFCEKSFPELAIFSLMRYNIKMIYMCVNIL